MGRVIRSAQAGAWQPWHGAATSRPDVRALAGGIRAVLEPMAAELLERQRAELAAKVAELTAYRHTLHAQAQVQAAQAEQDAAQRGYLEGVARAEAGMREAAAHDAARVGALLDALRREQQHWAAGQEDALLEVAFAAVCKLLGSQAADPATVRQLIRAAARDVAARDGVRVRVHPDDYQVLSAGGASVDGVVVEADAAVQLGGCLIDSLAGTLDARLETQLAELVKVLVTARAARRGVAGEA